jgi:hypothetical protein
MGVATGCLESFWSRPGRPEGRPLTYRRDGSLLTPRWRVRIPGEVARESAMMSPTIPI